jgi:hypothetical protein
MTDEERERYSLHYESLRDKALAMAYTLRKIDRELRDAAQCEGDYPGGYKPEDLLPNLCKIMYAAEGYHEEDDMLTAKELSRKYPKESKPLPETPPDIPIIR